MVDWKNIKVQEKVETVEKPKAEVSEEVANFYVEVAMTGYTNYIKAKYEDWQNRCYPNPDELQQKVSVDMIKQFKDGVSYKSGSKYIKVIRNDGQTSVHSFIVNTSNDAKFKYGDILKAASWRAPARNFARGNIFAKEYGTISWTGA